MKNKKKKKEGKYSSKLTLQEIHQYDMIGDINYDQDFLEMFSDRMIHDLVKIKDSDVSDNQAKADAVLKYMSSYGFVEIDLGTNIYVMAHHQYPGVVFKIALDDCGVADNFNDEWLQGYIPNLVNVLMIHPSGMVSVQERKVIFRQKSRINMFMNEILAMLRRLSNQFVLVDVSPESFRNYYIDRDGTVGLADASDLYLIPENYNIFKCRNIIGCKPNGKSIYCGGKLVYDDIYSQLICKKCGRVCNPWTLRRSKKEELEMCIISPGLTKQEWDDVNREAREIRRLSRSIEPGTNLNDALTKIRKKIAEERERKEQGTVVVHGDEMVSYSPNDFVENDEDDDSLDEQDDLYTNDEMLSDPDESDDQVTHGNNDQFSIMIDENKRMIDNQVYTRHHMNDSNEENHDVSDQVVSAISQRMGDGDCDVVIKYDDDGSPAIYVTTNTRNLTETLTTIGPNLYLSNDGGEEYTQVLTSKLLAKFISAQLDAMKEDGVWPNNEN